MNLQYHTQPHNLERYSFLWSQARLVIAAVALFMGGVPPLLALNPLPFLYQPLSSLLVISWIITGFASGYLLWRWHKNNQIIFGKKDQTTTAAFFISVVSGLNLGIMGLLGQNIGMNIARGKIIFIIVGVLYLAAAYKLHQTWQANNKKIF